MNFIDDLHQKYAPELSDVDFCIIWNNLENELFDAHPEYIKLPEEEQNRLVDIFFKERYGNAN